MKESDLDLFVFPEGVTEEEKIFFKKNIVRMAKEKERICVIYRPDCGCDLDQFVVLDRFPMSEKIISSCPSCGNRVLMEISNPITFHCPVLDKDYNLEDLKYCHLTESDQKPYLESYQIMVKRLSSHPNFLEGGVDNKST